MLFNNISYGIFHALSENECTCGRTETRHDVKMELFGSRFKIIYCTSVLRYERQLFE